MGLFGKYLKKAVSNDSDSAVMCPECYTIIKDDGFGNYICPVCGTDAMEDDTYDEDDIPEGCAACGGPYPSCTSSCKLFDD